VELILNLRNYHYVFHFCVVLFFLNPQFAFSLNSTDMQGIKEKQSSAGTLILKLKKDVPLDNLITNSGYFLDDANMNLFLSDFIRLNAAVKSVSLLKKETIIRLPLKYLKKVKYYANNTYNSNAVHVERRKIFKKKEIVRDAAATNRSLILKNIKTLFQSLEDNISIDSEGLKLFNIGDNRQVSLDKSFFPSIDLHNEHILIFDYTGIFPEDLKNLLEIFWPEFRFVSYKAGMDLKSLVYVLLNETGYAVNDSEKLIIGGRSQIEYYPDFLVYRRNPDFMDSEISFISIIDYDEKKTPDLLVNWLNKKNIKVVEISNHEFKPAMKTRTKNNYIDNNTSRGEFTENILTLMGYDFSRDKTINISNRKEFAYNLKADLSINLGYRSKVIEFTELSEYEIGYAKKQGFDISCISLWEEKRELIKKIMELLSLEYSNIPKTTAKYITPTKVRYKLFFPGTYVKSLKGAFFLTDSALENELLESVVDEKLTMVKF